jgi:ABC-2 type transport system permease protein
MRNRFYKGFWLPALLIILIGVNWLASLYHTRIDLTDQKRFTLAGATKKLLRKIDEPVTVEVFLKGNLNSGFRQLSTAANDLLREFKEVAGKNIKYSFIGPEEIMPGSEISYADSLVSMGLSPINVTSQLKEGQQQQFVYPFALLHYKGKVIPVELFKTESKGKPYEVLNNEEVMMEYRLAAGISKIMQAEKPQVGFLTGNGEPQDFRTYDLAQNFLARDYNLMIVDINKAHFIPEEFKVLIMVKPATGFTEEAKLQLDQYVMRGGKLIMFIDRLNAESDSLAIKNQVTAFDRNLGLTDLLFNYGAKINADLVMDLQCDYLPFDVNGNGQYEFLRWNYYPVLGSENDHPINKGLGLVAGKFVNSLDTVEAEGIKKTVLLNSSADARTIGSPAVISPSENVDAPKNEKFNKQNIPVALLLEGRFSSMYNNRLSQAMRDSLDLYKVPFASQCIKPNKMIIVSDGDIVLNTVGKDGPTANGRQSIHRGHTARIQFCQ